MDFEIRHQPIEFLPASLSHNHRVYIIVTANCFRFPTYCLVSTMTKSIVWAEDLAHPMPFSSRIWPDAPVTNNLCKLWCICFYHGVINHAKFYHNRLRGLNKVGDGRSNFGHFHRIDTSPLTRVLNYRSACDYARRGFKLITVINDVTYYVTHRIFNTKW